MKKRNYIPLGAAEITPGEILFEDYMKPMSLSIRELSRRMKCDPMRVSEIIRGKRSISAETSLMLGKAFSMSPDFWFNIQNTHDFAIAAKKHPELLAA